MNVSTQYRACPEEVLNNYIQLGFAIDAYTDVEPQPVVNAMIETVIDAIKNPSKPRPENEVILGEIARQLVDEHCSRVLH